MELKSLSLKNSRRPCKGTSPVMSYVKELCFASHKRAFCGIFRGLNSEGKPSLGEGGGVLRISSDGDD